MTTQRSAEERAFEKLTETKLYVTYRTAFKLATGLTLDLTRCEDEELAGLEPIRDGNPFCQKLNAGGGCGSCQVAHRELAGRSLQCGHSHQCFAGLKETAVPVRNGMNTVGFLHVGQVFDHEPKVGDFERVSAQIELEATPELREAYYATKVVSPESYLGAVMLLNTFALQLEEELNRLMVAEENCDPPTISKAKQYVNAHLDEKICLDDVAAHVHVSPYYFCKLFKQSTGMTLTEYVNRRRVEWAKRKLLNPQARVTEIAYDVGYQSLSQFNRSFLKYAGQSPTDYRAAIHGSKRTLAAA